MGLRVEKKMLPPSQLHRKPKPSRKPKKKAYSPGHKQKTYR